MKSIFRINKLTYQIGEKKLLQVSDLTIYEKDVIHLTGESGAGKSLFGMSLIGFYAAQSDVNYDYEIEDLHAANYIQLRKKSVGYIFQQPKAYFNPTRTCGSQLLELLADMSIEEAKKSILEWCVKLQIQSPELIFSKYPHEYSIGQLQRIYVVSALIRRPKLIIADEPFAHLDWKNANIVADCLGQYIKDNRGALLLISHETPGSLIKPSRLWNMVNGQISDETYNEKTTVNESEPSAPVQREQRHESLIMLSKIGKQYVKKFSFRSGENDKWVLDNIDLDIGAGDRIGIMGSSGSGKTTLAMILSGLLSASKGDSKGISSINFSLKTLWKRLPSSIQLVFQDPFSSFNPAQPVFDQLVNGDNRGQILELMEAFGLHQDLIRQNAMTLSGGELQRMAIIRALAVKGEPKLLIMDEALSALDAETKFKILQVLEQRHPNMAILFISHRYERLRHLCRSIHFLHEGQFIYTTLVGHEDWKGAPKIALELTGQV